ncbi:MAG: M48 family metallopeptidase [Lentimicrobiaceae bacterium]|nr:M48 family metallopeptidase [Lentimicrobiaceae bacterium]MCO5265974.1 M48 family metallopeptidase [Lentimicrobium sp.]
MSQLLYYFIFLFVIAGFLFEQLISFLNHLSRSGSVPSVLSDVYTKERYDTYIHYKSDSYRFGLLVSWLSFAATLLMLWGGFVYLDDMVSQWVDNRILQSLLFFGLLGLAADLLSMPFDLYDTFVIEQKYGFNKMTLATYFLDKIKSWLLAVLIGGGLLSLIIWLYSLLGSSFWWLAWIVITAFSLFFSLFYSTLIVPLFNKQTPLEPGELRDKLNTLAIQAGFDITGIYVIDGSKRSTRSNAYFSGFGSRRRIVLYDTLIQHQSSDQIAAVLAHEIGHYKRKHTIKGLIMSVLQTGLLLFLFSIIVGNPIIYEALGSSRQSFHLGLIVFVILYSPVSTLLSLFSNNISRRFEFEADAFAVQHTGREALASSLRILASDNLSDLTPHPLYVWVNYSHPPLKKRLEKIQGTEK